jgi:hypothetical protein
MEQQKHNRVYTINGIMVMQWPYLRMGYWLRNVKVAELSQTFIEYASTNAYTPKEGANWDEAAQYAEVCRRYLQNLAINSEEESTVSPEVPEILRKGILIVTVN